MAPTTRSRAEPRTRRKSTVYVLIDKTPRNRRAPATASAEEDDKEKPKSKAKGKAKAEMKGKGKARAESEAAAPEPASAEVQIEPGTALPSASEDAAVEQPKVKAKTKGRSKGKGKARAESEVLAADHASAEVQVGPSTALPSASADSATEGSKAKPKTKGPSRGKAKAKVQAEAPAPAEPNPELVPPSVSVVAAPELTPTQPAASTSAAAAHMPSPPPSPPRARPFALPHTPRRKSDIPPPGIRVRYPSSLPPSSPIELSPTPTPREPRTFRQDFAVHPGEPDEEELPVDEWDAEDKENQPADSEGDKENRFIEEDGEEKTDRTVPEPTEPVLDEDISDNEDLFAKGLRDSRDNSDHWSDTGAGQEDAPIVSALPDEPNPFDLTGIDDFIPEGSDKENENDFAFDLPVATTDFERGILQPRSPVPSQLEAVRIQAEDDPFGFFAAEKRLKARRQALAERETESLPFPTSAQPEAGPSQLPPSTAPRYSDSEIEDLYATPGSAHRVHVPATPRTPRARDASLVMTPRNRDARDASLVMTPRNRDARDASLVMTPRNHDAREVTMRRHRPREGAVVREEPGDASLPSSPSPSKSARKRASGDENGQEAVERPAKRARRAKGTGREKENAADPRAEGRRLEDLLPRRRLKRAAKGKARAKMAAESDEEEDEEDEGRGKKAARGRGATRGAGRGRGRGRGGRSKSEGSKGRKKQEESTDEELRERRERELQERIEYFKKLEDYELQEESVYVI